MNQFALPNIEFDALEAAAVSKRRYKTNAFQCVKKVDSPMAAWLAQAAVGGNLCRQLPLVFPQVHPIIRVLLEFLNPVYAMS